MNDDDLTRDDRSQAFTLEGFIASVVILTAVLFALQAIVLTPTTGGTVDQEVRSQLRIQANDILVTAAHNTSPGGQDKNLSYVVRYWNGSPTEDTWAEGIDSTIGYGSNQPPTLFGDMLNASFKQRGRVYNVIVEYRKNATARNESEQARMVYRGVPSDNAIVTKYTLTLYDNQTLTGPGASNDTELWEYSTNPNAGSDYYPIPDAFPDSPIYNIVEVRVVVW